MYSNLSSSIVAFIGLLISTGINVYANFYIRKEEYKKYVNGYLLFFFGTEFVLLFALMIISAGYIGYFLKW